MKKNIKNYEKQKKIFYYIIVLVFLLLCFCFVYRTQKWQMTQWVSHKCLFPILFEMYCPGCGGTRALHALMKGNILESLYYHPFVVYVAGIIFYYFFMGIYTFWWKRDGKIYYRYSNWILYMAVVIILVYAIVRNVLLICCDVDWIGDILWGYAYKNIFSKERKTMISLISIKHPVTVRSRADLLQYPKLIVGTRKWNTLYKNKK